MYKRASGKRQADKEDSFSPSPIGDINQQKAKNYRAEHLPLVSFFLGFYFQDLIEHVFFSFFKKNLRLENFVVYPEFD
jgi:hypothetical protein